MSNLNSQSWAQVLPTKSTNNNPAHLGTSVLSCQLEQMTMPPGYDLYETITFTVINQVSSQVVENPLTIRERFPLSLRKARIVKILQRKERCSLP